MSNLLDVTARTLTMGGRLVYVIPSFQEFDPKVDLPRHDCLELVHFCYQPFNGELGRRIIAMKKIAPYVETKGQEYRKTIWIYGADSADKCANLREKILEAAKQKTGYEEKAAIRKQKRKAHKQLKRTIQRVTAKEE
jgi:tRNA (guanine10-N2)-methyltransferase